MKYTIIIIAFVINGCGQTFREEYKKPDIIIPSNWKDKSTGMQWATASSHWWDIFNDPLLSKIINTMLIKNNDLAKAGLALQKSRIESGLTDTNLTPNLSSTLSVNGSENVGSKFNRNYSASTGLSYEIDLWGKLAATREQSEWDIQVNALDRQNTALTLIGTTATTYWKIAALNQQINNQLISIQLAKKTEQITRSMFLAGYVGRLDVLQAQESVLTQQSQYRNLVEQRTEQRNSLSVLFNQPPSMHLPEKNYLDLYQSIIVKPGLPLSIIRNRPDIQSAEANLRRTLSSADVARLNFLPSISLSSALATGSSYFRDWFSNPVKSFDISSALPFLQWNTMKLTIASSKIDIQQSVISYRNIVYLALTDVAKSAAQRDIYARERTDYQRTMELSRERLALAESQYRAGSVSIQSWLDAQRDFISNKNQLIDSQNNYLNATMALWLALGGEVVPE